MNFRASFRIPIRTKIFGLLLAVAAILLNESSLSAQESAPSCCGFPVVLTGNIHHFRTPAEIKVTGADNPAVFAGEVYGSSLTATVPGLLAGNYTVEIDLAETYKKAPGQRLMDIVCGDKTLAKRLDIFAVAGGFAKAHRFTAQVEHLGDALNGPLTITFNAVKGDAKFNAIFIRNSSGEGVASFLATEAKPMADAGDSKIPVVKEPAIYSDADKPLDARVDDMIRRMSLEEKAQQLANSAPAIARLGLPAYDYWNECLHGVARAGKATVFPQATGMAAMWDTPLMQQIGDTISTEGRAKYAEAGYGKDHRRYYGLTFWTPNINIFRDPRWGRGQETYGEDPFLTARLGVAFIHGLQGDDPHYLKAAGCAKHFAVHSGPEPSRHIFDVAPPERDLYETYLPQFEAAVREGKVAGVMGAYNSLNGVPCCASPFLLTRTLREKWGFDGYVTSDCGAVSDIFKTHKFAKTPEEAAAAALKAGCDLECGANDHRVQAVKAGLCSEADIDRALHHLLKIRFELGLFDPPSRVPFASIPATELNTPAHAAVALQAARESIVLLKNDGLLPLDKTKLHTVAVIGPNADSVPVLVGNYNGTPAAPVTFLQGIKNALGSQVSVTTAMGCPMALPVGQTPDTQSPDFQNAMELARAADAVIFVGGISAELEGEEGGKFKKLKLTGFAGGDRSEIELPAPQTALLQGLQKTGKPVVFVNCSGGAVAFPWAAEHLPAILQAWYPGQAGGTALADILFGNYNPSGRLPVTFYRATADLPAFENYAMSNRTYRYFTGKPLYPFGHGLSYTRFEYRDLKVNSSSAKADGKFSVSFNLKNIGALAGEEVVQLYVRHLNSKVPQPIRNLAAFQRVHLMANASTTVNLEFPASALRHWDVTAKRYAVEPGEFEIEVGASSEDIRTNVRSEIVE
jgi:beta-glucosidase